jgi:hypothetical protein
LAAAAALTVAALVVAAFAPADRAPVTATAAALTAVDRAVRAGAPDFADVVERVVAVGVGVDRAVDRVRASRWLGTGEASGVAAPPVRRPDGRAVRAVDAGPGTGSDPSARRRSWSSGLIHLTSVDRHDSAFPGRGARSM